MTDFRSPETPSGCRADARRLLNHLRGADPERARAAAARATVRLKHALAVLAEEQGFPSWVELKQSLEARTHAAEQALPSFHTPRHDSLLNRWFTDHGEARASLAEHGGYLLPFREQFFVTESEGILVLGLDPHDPDWSAVGFDLARPLDPAAHARLCARRRAAIAAGAGVPPAPRRPS